MTTTLQAIPSHPARTVDTLSDIVVSDDGAVTMVFDQVTRRRGRAAGSSIIELSPEHAAQLAAVLPKPRARKAAKAGGGK